jgi:copper homeostasis protein
MLLEIPVFDINSALMAQRAGAHRIELCASISDGGITPSYGMILQAKQMLHIPFYVMIRPRGGNFTYTDEEFDIMLNDIEFCRSNAIEGVVSGILTADGHVDKHSCKKLIQASGTMQFTFHRAFDRATNPFQALEDIIECGFHRILTSGQKETAIEGAELIAQLNKKAAKRITIMPGSGVTEFNLNDLHSICQCTEYHSSAKTKTPISYAHPLPSDDQNIWTVSHEKVEQMLNEMKKLIS